MAFSEAMLAMKVWSHRKAIHRRRASVLGSIKRIGVRQMSEALQSGDSSGGVK